MKSRIMATFENCEIFSTYYFSHVRGYKAALRSGNYISLGSIFFTNFNKRHDNDNKLINSFFSKNHIISLTVQRSLKYMRL